MGDDSDCPKVSQALASASDLLCCAQKMQTGGHVAGDVFKFRKVLVDFGERIKVDAQDGFRDLHTSFEKTCAAVHKAMSDMNNSMHADTVRP